MKIKFYNSLIIVLLLFKAQAFSQWSIVHTEADSLIKLGTDHIYNIQFDKAGDCFKQVIKKYPENPAGYFLDAMIEWWKISIYTDSRKYDKIFLKKVDRVINLSNKLLKEDPYNIGALFFKGGALGYRGRFYAQRKSYFKALADGQEGYNIFIRCLELAPGNPDIMLGTGLFNYFVEAFPEKYPKIEGILKSVLPRGDKRLGVLQLEAASRNARYAATEAKVVLLQIYYQFEKNYQKSLAAAKELNKMYPNNPYFHKYLGRSYVTTGDLNNWDRTWREILRRYIKKKPGYSKSIAREACYYVGSSEQRKRNFAKAIKYYKKCIEASNVVDKDDEDTGFKVKATLRIGKMYDMLNKHKEAVKYYEMVLDMDEYDGSHDDAEKYIKKPYR